VDEPHLGACNLRDGGIRQSRITEGASHA
jgi:hypothetical protein